MNRPEPALALGARIKSLPRNSVIQHTGRREHALSNAPARRGHCIHLDAHTGGRNTARDINGMYRQSWHGITSQMVLQ